MGALAGAEAPQPSRQVADGTRHPARCTPDTHALALPQASLPSRRLPWPRAEPQGRSAPEGGGPARGGPGGLLGGPKSRARVLLSAEFRLRQFGCSGGRSSPQLTSALPPAGGQHHFSFASSRGAASLQLCLQPGGGITSALPPAGGRHLATLPHTLHPATHSGWTPVPRPRRGAWGRRTHSCGAICSVSAISPPHHLSPHSPLLLRQPRDLEPPGAPACPESMFPN